MSPEQPPVGAHRPSTARAVRRHLALVVVCVVLGTLAGLLYASARPTTWTSTARVLVNPSVGNPFVPTPSAVRQDELTSLETEAQVARSAEVLDTLAGQELPQTTAVLARGLQVVVPPNTQILEITYAGSDATLAQRTTELVAEAYLANRARRFDEVNAERIDRLQAQTEGVIDDLRSASAAAQSGTAAERLFQTQLATALRNDLVSLRAQRTALETSETPAGAVISPATTPRRPADLVGILAPVAGLLLGLVIGCLLAVLLERLRGVVRTAAEVEDAGLVVAAAVPPHRWPTSRRRRRASGAFETAVRRLRATLLEVEPRPDVLAVAPAGSGESDADVAEAVATSFARGGHRVVLVRTDGHRPTSSLAKEEGWADALMHERLNVLELLQPSVEPLLCILPGGFTPQSRELLIADRVRATLAPLVEDGNLVVVQAPGTDTTEGEALLGAADLGVVVVTTDRTRLAAVTRSVEQGGSRVPLAALVVGPHDATDGAGLAGGDGETPTRRGEAVTHRTLVRGR